MSETANDLYRLISSIQNDLIELRARLVDLDLLDAPDTPGRRRTGWKFGRGSHSGSYIRDPNGTDPLPQGHQQ